MESEDIRISRAGSSSRGTAMDACLAHLLGKHLWEILRASWAAVAVQGRELEPSVPTCMNANH